MRVERVMGLHHASDGLIEGSGHPLAGKRLQPLGFEELVLHVEGRGVQIGAHVHAVLHVVDTHLFVTIISI